MQNDETRNFRRFPLKSRGFRVILWLARKLRERAGRESIRRGARRRLGRAGGRAVGAGLRGFGFLFPRLLFIIPKRAALFNKGCGEENGVNGFETVGVPGWVDGFGPAQRRAAVLQAEKEFHMEEIRRIEDEMADLAAECWEGF